MLALQPVLAQSAAERLQAFFRKVETLDADFTQQVFGEDGELVAESSGEVQLMRPDHFRWEYEQPDQQLILADGERLWIYDRELEQATVKSIDDALGAAPIMLLTGERPLEEQFRVVEAEPQDSLDWVELIPRVQDMEFNRIKLGLDEQGVARMELHDQFGQTTEIHLRDVHTNIEIDPARFRFESPAGTDVIDATR
jgi:outer membrane lipoprotein carrier protein